MSSKICSFLRNGCVKFLPARQSLQTYAANRRETSSIYTNYKVKTSTKTRETWAKVTTGFLILLITTMFSFRKYILLLFRLCSAYLEKMIFLTASKRSKSSLRFVPRLLHWSLAAKLHPQK